MSDKFLKEPHPERILYGNFLNNEDVDVLTVGVQFIEKDRAGLKVIPHKEIVVAIGTRAESGREVSSFAVLYGESSRASHHRYVRRD